MRTRCARADVISARWALLVLLLILASPTLASEPKFPRLTRRVVDDADILNVYTRRKLTDMLAAHERATGDQVVVVTLASLQRYPIEEFGYELGRYWGIGQKGKNNGALLIVAPNEHKVRIEVGYGLEGQLTDAKSRAIIDNYILPSFRRGDFNFGVLAGATEMVRALGGNPPDEGEPATWFPQNNSAPAGFGSLFHPPDSKALAALVLFFLIPLIGTVLLVGALTTGPRGSSSYRWDSDSGSSGRSYGGSSSGGGSSGGGVGSPAVADLSAAEAPREAGDYCETARHSSAMGVARSSSGSRVAHSRLRTEISVLNSYTVGELTEILAAHERASGEQVVVVTLPSLQGYTIEDFGYQLGRNWGIGQKGKNNGVLLIVAPRERKVRIEVGYGLEGELTDAICATIIQNYILPSLKRGDFNAGVLAGAKSILDVLGGNSPQTSVPNTSGVPVAVAVLPYAVLIPLLGMMFFSLWALLTACSCSAPRPLWPGFGGPVHRRTFFRRRWWRLLRRWRIFRRRRRFGKLVKMKSEKVKSPFTPAEHERIDAAIAEIGRSTAANLCVVVTRASDRYSPYPVSWSAIGAILLGALVSLLRPDIASSVVIMIQLWFLIVTALLLEWLPLRLWIVPTRVKHARAQQLAHREFNAHAIANPEQQHRILLFLSLGERYVEIIADHGTHALAPEGTWNKIVDRFRATVKAGRVADGVLDAIAACGAILKEHHPAANPS